MADTDGLGTPRREPPTLWASTTRVLKGHLDPPATATNGKHGEQQRTVADNPGVLGDRVPVLGCPHGPDGAGVLAVE